VFLCLFLLHGFDAIVHEFDYFTAHDTDQVVVMISAAGGFKPRQSVLEIFYRGKPGIREEFQSPVDGGQADCRGGALYLSVEFLGTDMALVSEKGCGNKLSLVGKPQALAAKIAFESLEDFRTHISPCGMKE
jgi:hypothetical protein